VWGGGEGKSIGTGAGGRGMGAWKKRVVSEMEKRARRGLCSRGNTGNKGDASSRKRERPSSLQFSHRLLYEKRR